jgi:endonuclease G
MVALTSATNPAYRHRHAASLFALFLGLLAGPVSVAAEPAACPQLFLDGRPPALTNARLAQRTTLLCNDAFAVLASGVTHGAIWSAERPTSASVAAARMTERAGRFHPDDRLPAGDQARLEDYRQSGYDRGHMTPSGDMPDERSQQQSFSLANMVPQASTLNRGAWAGIETAVRDLAADEGELFVVTGPMFQGQELQSIGPDGVLVPSMIWKAVYSRSRRGAAAYVCENTSKPECQIVSVAVLTRAAGVDPFPSLSESVKATAIALPAPNQGQHAFRSQRKRPRDARSWLEQLLGPIGAP